MGKKREILSLIGEIRREFLEQVPDLGSRSGDVGLG